MRNILLIVATLTSLTEVYAQLSQTVNPVIDQMGNLYMKPGSNIPEPRTIVYLNEAWSPSSFSLYNSQTETPDFSYDKVRFVINSNLFEFLVGDQVKVLDASRVRMFTLKNQGQTYEFINCKEFSMSPIPLVGFCAVKGEGEIKLVNHISAEILQADYNVALDVGHKEERAVRKNTYYFLVDGKLIEVSRRSTLTLARDKSALKKYLHSHKVRWSNENDLVLLLPYVNQ